MLPLVGCASIQTIPDAADTTAVIELRREGALERRIHTEVVIDAPAETVWAELTDFAAMPSWSRSLQSIEGTLGAGAEVVVYFMNDKGEVGKFPHTLKVFEAGRSFGWSDPIPGTGVRDDHLYLVEALPDGRTRFTQNDAATGFTSLFLGGLVMDFFRDTYPVFNRTLKARAEKRGKQ
jgi:uncharacterized protein YndB with AHSA1/START domain